MSDLQGMIEVRLRRAIVSALGDDHAQADPMVRPANDAKFGDFQANLAMPLAKALGLKPREVAERVVAQIEGGGWLGKAEIAGPGFINLTLLPEALGTAAMSLLGDTQLGVATAQPAQRVVVDYASPNLAKEMHIGHLRSTIIGDALARVLAFQGHHVTRQNHIGDWGTQFGMLLEHLIDTQWSAKDAGGISDLNTLYQEAKRRDDADPGFAERARQRVVALQAGEPEARALWQQLIGESVRHMNETFALLGVQLTDADLRPESFYNDKLAQTCADLETLGVARISDGALAVFVEGSDTPLIIRKGDGGYGYATTDLAAVRFRVGELGADRVVYVVDSRQRDHFGKFFTAARKAGWVSDAVRLDYVSFGTVLGGDRKPFKTREGGTVKLSDVLSEAVQRADAAIGEKNVDLQPQERKQVARAIGIGAVKYADLSNDRVKDYVFDWDRMLAMEGNTAPYLQYSYTRIVSILRKAPPELGVTMSNVASCSVNITEPAERQLALKATQFASTVASVGESLEPHRLCNYLYELATLYHRFYEQCPVLKAGDEATVRSRLALCALVARTIERGLGLLGIEVVERM